MANTPTKAIPYATPQDAPDVPYWSQRAAERNEALHIAADTARAQVAADLAALDAGEYAACTLHVDYASQGPDEMAVSAQGSLVVLSGRVYRKAGKTTTVIGYVPAGFRPVQVAHASMTSRVGTTGSTGPEFHLYVNPADGALGLTLLNAATWNDTHWIPLNVVWRRA